MKLPTFRLTSKHLFIVVGLGIIIWNAVWGTAAIPTFIVGLTLCGLVPAVALDELIHRADPPPPDPAPVKEAAP